MQPLRTKKMFRIIATFVAACYFFVGMALSFQHVDCMSREVEIALRLPASNTPVVRLPAKTQIASTHRSAHKPHVCAACEWQTNNASLALPTFTLFFAPLTRVRAITTFPRYLRVRLVSTSSRAPPIV